MQTVTCGITRLSFTSLRGALARNIARPAVWTRLPIQPCRNLQTPSAASSTANTSITGPNETFLQTENSLLIRARRYGIFSVADLQRQSSLYTIKGLGSCLVDRQFRSDLELWDILLDYQLQHFGLKGAKTIWRGMKYRGKPVKLESEDVVTTNLWQKLLSAAVEAHDLTFLKLLCEDNGLAWNRPKLFTEVISTLLRCDQEHQAAYMCFYLRKKQIHEQASITDLYKTFRPQDYKQLKQFCSFYLNVPAAKIYDEAIRDLWEEERIDDAFLLHKFLIARGDLPSSFDEIAPFMRHLARKHHDPTPFIRQLITAGAMFSHQARESYHEELDRNGGDFPSSSHSLARPDWSPPSKKKSVTDTFAARAFATKALSFGFVLNSLRLFGLTEIGPQSMRQIGLTAADPETYASRLSTLEELNIDTGSSAYSRLVRKLCFAKQYSLWEETLNTNMHHEVFEDVALQEKLLAEHFNKSDWKSVNLLLAMLNNGDVDGKSNVAYQRLLETVAEDRRTRRSLLSLISCQSLHNTTESIGLRLRAIDRLSMVLVGDKTEPSKKASMLLHAQLLAGLMQDAVAAGAPIHGRQWRLILSRLGRAGDYKAITSLSLWLAEYYSSQRLCLPAARKTGVDHHIDLSEFFNVNYQAAIIVWALRRDLRAGLPKASWQNVKRGLGLLKQLDDRYKVRINLPTIRKALVATFRAYEHKARVGWVGSNRARPYHSPKKVLTDLLRMVHTMWSRSKDDVEQEIEVALDSLRTDKRVKDGIDRRFGKEGRALLRRSRHKGIEDSTGPSRITTPPEAVSG